MSSAAQQVWVLGGGGLTGIAWQTGMLAGLADEGVLLDPSATILGTSAGSTVAAQVGSGVPIAELYERQLAGVDYEISKGLSGGSLLRYLSAYLFTRTPVAAGRRIGAMAIKAKVGPIAERRAVIEQRLPQHEWSDRDVRVVAIDALTGEARVITRADGLNLVDAVAASCAIPLVWPPVELDGRLYIDGGMRSSLNMDLAPGSGPVIALSPSSASLSRFGRIEAQRSRLAPDRVVEVVSMSDESKAAQGKNSLDKSVVPATAAAGREQGRREAARVAAALRRA